VILIYEVFFNIVFNNQFLGNFSQFYDVNHN